MALNPPSDPQPQGGNNPRPKPYEQAGTLSSSTPFRPPSSGRTSDVVEGSGTARPGEIVQSTERNAAVNTNSVGRPLPTRPWEQNYGNSYGVYNNSSLGFNSGYGSGMYNSYGGYGGSYGGGLYGNNMYRSPYGGTYSSGMYGGGMNGGFGGPMAGYGMGMGGPYGNQDPNNPFGQPSQPPSFWVSFLNMMQGVVSFFGRISILIDQNTQAFHMFMTALLQLFDRSGVLYGELARFVLRMLGIRTKARKPHPQGPGALSGPNAHRPNHIEGPSAPKLLEGPCQESHSDSARAAGTSWDNYWGND